MAGGHAWQGGMRGRGCVAGGGGVHGRYYEIRSMSGRYASYCNAFLLCFIFLYISWDISSFNTLYKFVFLVIKEKLDCKYNIRVFPILYWIN